MLIFVVGFSAVATSQELRPEPRPVKIGSIKMNTSFVSYADAVKRFNNSFVLCNNVPTIDPSIWDNVYFDFEDAGEILQFYISDCSSEDVKYLSSWFGLLFVYSEILDCFVLCVDHWGTAWSGVMIEDRSPRF